MTEPVVTDTEATDTDVTGGVAPSSLSPSRAADFKTCPLLYRYRAIDRLPEEPSAAAVRGTVVHSVLEQLFDLPPAQRTPEQARALIEPAWQVLLDEVPELLAMFDDDDALQRWLDSAHTLVTTYFQMEDPTRLEPAGREVLVEATLDDGLLLRGYVDRIDEAPDGQIRVVDYKTGAAPREAFEAKALFQMKFYALVIWLTRGTIPAQLKLMYLADRDALSYAPDEQELRSLTRQLQALWRAIELSLERQEFRPHRSRLCDWCSFQAICPEFGGTPPPFPAAGVATMAADRRTEIADAD